MNTTLSTGLRCAVVAAMLSNAAPSFAQTSDTLPSARGGDSRPATSTFFGDTGLWFVPTAEVLPKGDASASGYRRGTNFVQGYTNIADFAGTFAAGITGRVEVFGSFLVDTRIDRDARPIFFSDPASGGIVDRYPGVHQVWTGNNLGDLYVGTKVNLLSESRHEPIALAVRGIVKVPTGDKEAGVSTGKADVGIDIVASKEIRRMVEWAGFGGYEFRGRPDGFDIPTSAFRWGTGITFPSRRPIRGLVELNGYVPSADGATTTSQSFTGADGSVPPVFSSTENLTRATVGLTFQARNGFFGGAGVSWNLPRQGRIQAQSEGGDQPFNDYWDMQFRIGFHPGVRAYVPPPPPSTPMPVPSPAPVAEHTLTLRASCNPCSVNVLQSSAVTATAQDSIMCALSYRWAAPVGAIDNPTSRDTVWTAPNQEGTVPITVTATCPTDSKTATATVNIQVSRPAVKTYTFEDVHFDFDRYTLRPEAARALDEAVTAMKSDPAITLRIEGHTCSIGTAEYNLALGDRRANAVKDYLVSRGIAIARLTTISYGEEAPKYDNEREETRRLNRRAALVVALQR